jgi:uncharacterized protein YegP (UPF0339 family)
MRLLQRRRPKHTLVVYARADHRWAWRLVAPNGQCVATDGGQGYERLDDCMRGAVSAHRGLSNATLVIEHSDDDVDG